MDESTFVKNDICIDVMQKNDNLLVNHYHGTSLNP